MAATIAKLTLASLRRPLLPRRTFFASSTDHTRLLETAEVHVISREGGTRQYVMAAHGMDLDTITKVPQLHLARIYLGPDGSTIYGARSVNRTLGSISDVCSRVLDAAMTDAMAGGGTSAMRARSTLHGLSEWAEGGLGVTEKKGSGPIRCLGDMLVEDREAVRIVASGKALGGGEAYDAARGGWESLAAEFVGLGLGDEAALYGSRGGVLERIEHLADDGDFADASGGAMAIFKFS